MQACTVLYHPRNQLVLWVDLDLVASHYRQSDCPQVPLDRQIGSLGFSQGSFRAPRRLGWNQVSAWTLRNQNVPHIQRSRPLVALLSKSLAFTQFPNTFPCWTKLRHMAKMRSTDLLRKFCSWCLFHYGISLYFEL